ncbi:MAG TPA: tetratricopeptide repeat protein [Rhodanobacteraceae bacterium]|nr:tetratricopeptide repeat protein [Rhodanobacteraceae bacterium]
MSSDPQFTISASPRELENAHRLIREGRLAEAEQVFRKVLETQPEQIEALRFLANAALARGRAGEAIDLLNRAAVVDRTDIGVLMELGVAYRGADRRDESRYVLERALQVSGGRNTTARLLLANVLELDQRPELALAQYFRAILDAQSAGQWLNDESTEPGLRQLVLHAMRYVADGRRTLFTGALQSMRERGAAISRVERALAMYLGESGESRADVRQRPSFLYVPGLGATPFLDVSWCGWLEKFLQRIAAAGDEVAACFAASGHAPQSGASPFSLGTLLATQTPEAPQPERRVPIYQRGLLHEGPRQHAPQLLAALAETPMVHIARHGPDAEIIELAGKARSSLRYGRTNSRCGVAIALPGGTPLRVLAGGEARALEAGQAVMFDPSFGVEYANDGTAPVRVLAFEIWHPDLSEHEREALAALTEAVIEFDARVQGLD